MDTPWTMRSLSIGWCGGWASLAKLSGGLRPTSLTKVSVSALMILPPPLLPSLGWGATRLNSWTSTFLSVPAASYYFSETRHFFSLLQGWLSSLFPTTHCCVPCSASPWPPYWHWDGPSLHIWVMIPSGKILSKLRPFSLNAILKQ